jgi:hypothetical protein
VTAGAVAAVALIALAIWALRRYGVSLHLRLNGAFQVEAERAPAMHAALIELSMMLDLPRPRLFVTGGAWPAAFAIRRRGLTAVGLTEAALERLSPQEISGVLALLAALLASPGGWRRQREPADWFATDALAKRLIGADAVIAALFALASSRRGPSLPERLLASVAPDVVALIPARPPIVARIAQLNEPGGDEASSQKAPRPQ